MALRVVSLKQLKLEVLLEPGRTGTPVPRTRRRSASWSASTARSRSGCASRRRRPISKPWRVAAVDLGTNTTRLLVAVSPDVYRVCSEKIGQRASEDDEEEEEEE
jgi:hypothetical protein